MTIADRRRIGRGRALGTVVAAAWLAMALAHWPGPAAGQAPLQAKIDSDEPIEITADSLEVRQQEGVAIFSGNVDSIQGRMRLRADALEVYYRTEGAGGAAMPAQGAISRMHAKGRVFVSSPTETAQGDEGVYDVVARTIVLTGHVVLTRGDNVVRGTRLTLDLGTGVSRIEGKAGAAGERQRVKGLFMPTRKPKRK